MHKLDENKTMNDFLSSEVLIAKSFEVCVEKF